MKLSELSPPTCPVCHTRLREKNWRAVFQRAGDFVVEWECPSCGVVFCLEAEEYAPDTESF